MNIYTAKDMSLDQILSEYRKYLQQKGLSKNTINTSVNDAFYLWKNAGVDVFWNNILSENFEADYKAAMLSALRAHSKGDPNKLVGGYMSHGRRFREFLFGDSSAIGIAVDEVGKYLKRWNALENYHLQEDALDKLFFSLCPNNTDISDILIKVSTLNDFYSTNIFSVYPVAKHILSMDVDARLKAGDVTLISDIQKVTINGVEKNFYSFATKYCSHHNPLEFPIYDSYVEKVLKYFRDKDGFSVFTNVDLKDYIRFKGVLIDFRKFYNLEQ